MSMDDPIEMIRMLQQKMDEMQQRHEDELAAVKAECEARIAREIAGKGGEDERAKEKGKAAAEDHTKHNSGRDKTWKSTEPEAKGSKAKSIHAESDAEDRLMVVKPEPSSTLLLPYAQPIMDVQISEQFVAPQFKMYDGTMDPEAHIKTFSNAMAFRTGNDAIWCRAFSLSLEEEALEWFNSLPPNSIENFDSLKCLFIRQFAVNNTQDLTVFELVTLKQGKEETLRVFMDRYQKTVRRVKALSPELALHYILPTLKPGPFKDSVYRRAPKTMEELRERAADEIRVEEMKLSYKKESQELRGERADGGKSGNSAGKPSGLRQKEPRRGPRFQQYNPLNTPREKILREALSADLLPKPMKRPTPSGADGSKHYVYHKNMGHTTEECVTLKDKIEELIRAGQLKKYIRVDRSQAPVERLGPRQASNPTGLRTIGSIARARNGDEEEVVVEVASVL
ncbi:uncharacterized protein LOC124848221 [Vigna umbellata]|uniref:uncharacterized protein LOC124848221 n=1 Tax=Vigna umbellata TaxID=87088 RepID=UPI001F5E6E3D|nr:uncharacterized protein LOC124848221 [Vigna umbellata]